MMKLLFLHCSCFQLLLFLLQSAPIVPSAAASATCRFPALFVLGDSNSDTGGFSAAFGPLTRPYGETFFGMPAGRFSDGRLIVDFIAESLGLPRISSYLDSLGANYSHGASFATALSTILPQNVTLARGGYSPFSLDVQLKQFSQFKSRSQFLHRQGNVFTHLMPKEEYFSRGLYLFDIGQNDLTALYFLNRPRKQYLSNALTELSMAIRKIYEKGGRSFWIHNTGPLGCLPYVLVGVVNRNSTGSVQLDSSGCLTVLNALARQFNRMLDDTVKQLREDLPLAALTLVDVYSVKYSLIKEAAKHGFQDPLRACCGHGGGEYNYDAGARCGKTAEVAGKSVLIGRSCRDPGRKIIWDGAHYTEAANKWVFDRIAGGAFSYPPNSLSRACHKKRPNK